jgi:hypothetical protein
VQLANVQRLERAEAGAKHHSAASVENASGGEHAGCEGVEQLLALLEDIALEQLAQGPR